MIETDIKNKIYIKPSICFGSLPNLPKTRHLCSHGCHGKQLETK